DALGREQPGQQEHRAQRDETYALEDAQRARHQPEVFLGIEGIGEQRRADGETEQALRAEGPAKGVGVHAATIRKKRNPGTWPGLRRRADPWSARLSGAPTMGRLYVRSVGLRAVDQFDVGH